MSKYTDLEKKQIEEKIDELETIVDTQIREKLPSDFKKIGVVKNFLDEADAGNITILYRDPEENTLNIIITSFIYRTLLEDEDLGTLQVRNIQFNFGRNFISYKILN